MSTPIVRITHPKKGTTVTDPLTIKGTCVNPPPGSRVSCEVRSPGKVTTLDAEVKPDGTWSVGVSLGARPGEEIDLRAYLASPQSQGDGDHGVRVVAGEALVMQ